MLHLFVLLVTIEKKMVLVSFEETFYPKYKPVNKKTDVTAFRRIVSKFLEEITKDTVDETSNWYQHFWGKRAFESKYQIFLMEESTEIGIYNSSLHLTLKNQSLDCIDQHWCRSWFPTKKSYFKSIEHELPLVFPWMSKLSSTEN